MMDRRKFLMRMAQLGVGLSAMPLARLASGYAAGRKKKMLVLGIDGMDVRLTLEFLKQGIMPNTARLAKAGSLVPVGSSIPPQSPVAWSNVTVGAPPELHGIYDFIHRDPSTMIPYLSTSRVLPPGRVLNFAGYTLPLSGGGTELLRKGKPFWKYLAERDIPATIFKMPANFPCLDDGVKMVSGMGTPDLRGGYGNFTIFTTDKKHLEANYSGGTVMPAVFKQGRALAMLPGPANSLREGNPASAISLGAWRDSTNPTARIRIQDAELLMAEGEWSAWIKISFPMLGSLYNVKGICRLYMQSVHPEFTLYVSPLNMDPGEPALPLASPEAYGEELSRNVGPFYTQGFPEDTKALSEGVFADGEYLGLARYILKESERLFEYELARFSRMNEGLLFFYFGSLDLNSHMFWRAIDSGSPLYTDKLHAGFGDTLKGLYVEMDRIIGKIFDKFDLADPDLMVSIMSDHGFCPFRRQVNLNTWLYKNEYLSLKTPVDLDDEGYFSRVDWAKTGAYNLGINGIYLNLEGRERTGAVPLAQAMEVLNQLKRELLELRDPVTGATVVSRVRIVGEEERHRNPHAPDLIVGWATGYRTSWRSILGGFEHDIISDNQDKWSGDHCVDPMIVPAIFISNKKVVKEGPHLTDIGPTILAHFGIQTPAAMTGRPLCGV